MFTLVRFSDNSEGIYDTRKIKVIKNNVCIVKHGGCNYEASIIATNDSKVILTAKDNVGSSLLNLTPKETQNKSFNLESTSFIELGNFSIGSDFVEDNSHFMDNSFQDPCSLIRSFNELENPEVPVKLKQADEEEILSDGESVGEAQYESVDDSLKDENYHPSDSDTENEEYENSHNVSDMEIKNVENQTPNGSKRISTSFLEAGCDDTNMFVSDSRGKKGDKKAQFCVYCNTKQQKIARHLENKHKEEEEVKKFMFLPKGNIERKAIISKIRKEGNFKFNTNKLLNDGELIVSRRPQKRMNKEATDFKACGSCKGFFSASTLRLHFKQCSGQGRSTHRIVNLLSKRITSRIHPIASNTVKKYLFPVLREDDVVRLIRFDEIIIIYANKMVIKYREKRHFEMIRQRLRLLGRFLLNIKTLNKEISNMSSVFDPKYIEETLSAINKTARFNYETSTYEAPTVAFTLGTLLNQLGKFLITESIKNHNDSKQKDTKNFLKLLSQECNINVNRTVAESQATHKRRKNVVLPSLEDIKALHMFLTQRQNRAYEYIKSSFSFKVWLELAETTLILIQLFNRRRAGEVERILIADFHTYQGIHEVSDKDLFDSLDNRCKEVAKKYVRFQIRGKLNRTVPVLLDKRLVACVKTILLHRGDAGVSESNPYGFGVPGSNERHKYLRACSLLRQFSKQCGAKYPERLRGTNLRKHMATTCINLNLQEQDISDLANFMGHAEKIHKTIYRQPLISREILRMSKLLEVAQGKEQENSGTDDDGSEDSDVDETQDNVRSCLPSTSNKPTSYTHSIKRTRWTEKEKKIVKTEFAAYFKDQTLPPLHDVQRVIRENPDLQNRTSPQIRTWIHNNLKKTIKKRLSFNI